MNMMKRKSVLLLTTAVIVTIFAAAAAAAPLKSRPLMIEEQGSFAAGGSIVSSPGKFDPYKWNGDGQTLHGDHASVFYQIPVKARKLSLVFLHGAGPVSYTHLDVYKRQVSASVGCNRILHDYGIAYPMCDPKESEEKQALQRYEIMCKAVDALCTDIKQQTIF